DGIRDGHVTGVQTCALPIFQWYVSPRITTCLCGNWEQPHKQVVFRGETYHWSKHFEFLKFLDLPSKAPPGTQFELALASYDEGKIGRASCRERVWVREVAGA